MSGFEPPGECHAFFQDTLQVRPCKLGRNIPVSYGPEKNMALPWLLHLTLKQCVFPAKEMQPRCFKLGWVFTPGTVANRDVGSELTGMYLQRVPGVNTHLGDPTANK